MWGMHDGTQNCERFVAVSAEVGGQKGAVVVGKLKSANSMRWKLSRVQV